MLLTLLLTAAALPIAAAAAEPDMLRWPDVVAAVDRDPRFGAARATSAAAHAGVGAAAAVPNPEVEASLGKGSAREGDSTRAEWDLAVRVPLEWLARRGPAVDAARAEAAVADAEADALRRDVTAELRRLYVDAAYQQELAATLMGTEEQVSTLASLVRRRVGAGEARPVEVPRIEIELERVRGERSRAESERAEAMGRLSGWLGRAVRRVELPAPTPVPGREADGPTHPVVRAADARVAAARAEADSARRGRIPAFSIGAFYASELDRRAAGLTLSTALPLWNWNGPAIDRAAARAEAEAARAEATRRQVAVELAGALAACERSAADAERQTTRIVPRAEESARTLERSFELGEANLIDVIDARRVLLDARRGALTSARQREVDCGTSIILSGGEIP